MITYVLVKCIFSSYNNVPYTICDYTSESNIQQFYIITFYCQNLKLTARSQLCNKYYNMKAIAIYSKNILLATIYINTTKLSSTCVVAGQHHFYTLYTVYVYSNFQIEKLLKTQLSETLKTFSKTKQGYSQLSLLLSYFKTLLSKIPYSF